MCFGIRKALKLVVATRMLLVKCYDIKMIKLPLIWVIYPLTQPQVVNQQKKLSETIIVLSTSLGFNSKYISKEYEGKSNNVVQQC